MHLEPPQVMNEAAPFDEDVLAMLSVEQRLASIKRANAIGNFLDRPIFIAGMGRSGTTLLLRLLDGHPEIFLVPLESLVLTHILPAYRKSGDFSALREAILVRIRRMKRTFHDEEQLAAARKHMDKVLVEANARCAVTPHMIFRALLQSLALGQSTDGRRVWLEKSPKNELHLDTIFHDFPKARVIFNVRDPRAVYYSFRKGGRSITPEAIGRKWTVRINALCEFLARHHELRNRFYIVRYEDYVREPTEIGRILNFLGLGQLSSVQPTFLGEPFKGNSWDPSTDTPGRIDSKKADAWRSALSGQDIQEVERTARFEMGLLGYRTDAQFARI